MSSERQLGARPLRQRLNQRVREAQEFGSTVEEAIDEVGGFLRDQAQCRPYTALAGAAAVGYVLGGGLPTRVIGLVAALGGRLAVEMFLRELIGTPAQHEHMRAVSGTGGSLP